MGLILSALTLATPSRVAMFFQEWLGNLTACNGMGGQFAAGVSKGCW